MEIIKEKDNESVELINKGKHLKFSLTDLYFLKLTLSNENKDKMWINETFEVDKEDKEIYKMIDGLFFSYGDKVLFDTMGDSLILKHEEDKYEFFFLSNLNRIGDNLSCEFIDYTTENSSMENLFLKLQDVEPTVVKENNKKIVKRIK